MDTLNNSSPNRYEQQKQKKASREAEALKARRLRVLKKTVYWLVGLALVAGGLWLAVRANGPNGPDYSQALPILGREHVAEGTTVTYNSNPPTSGPHYPVPAAVRFYDQELRDEQLVHNLEHGQVWISYKPGLSVEIINSLKGLAGGSVIVTLRSKNDTDIALAAWGRLDKFNVGAGGLDKRRIKDFIARYQNNGPENPSSFGGHLRQ